MSDVTRILSAIERGDPQAANELLPLVYDELRKLAAQRLTHEKPGQTLQATALVHEAYIRLVDDAKSQHWNSRGHFFAAAAEAMRRILVESRARTNNDSSEVASARESISTKLRLPSIHRTTACSHWTMRLQRLAESDQLGANLVKLRFFAGLNAERRC